MLSSSLVRFGTSTWTYEGWQGIVYHKAYSPGRFKRDCLAEYAAYQYKGRPLFQTVGFDFTFYRPPTPRQLDSYARQLPPGFEACSKVWKDVTVPVFAKHERYGAKAGQPNPRFLDDKLFVQEMLAPYEQVFLDHTGPFIFEFQRAGIEEEEFLARLDHFLSRLPRSYSYAVEVRTPRLLTERYWSMLKAHEVAHVYNHWTYMPPLAAQHQKLNEAFTAPFAVLRLLTPIRVSYEAAVKTAQPFNRIVNPLPQMQADTVQLVRQAVREQRRAYVLVNNRAEGCAPLTIQALVDQIESGGMLQVNERSAAP